jgi:IS605 OrfB family transposase
MPKEKLITTLQGEVTFKSEEDQLLADNKIDAWSSCQRFCFNRITEGITREEIRQLASEKYFALNARDISDCYEEARQIVASQKEDLDRRILQEEEKIASYNSTKKNGYLTKKRQKKLTQSQKKLKELKDHKKNNTIPKIIFGGKNNYYERMKGKISQEEFRANRDKHLYSRGEKSRKGNQNLRVLFEEQPKLRITVGNRKYIYGKLWINGIEILQGLDCYTVRIIRKLKGNKYRYYVHITYSEAIPEPVITFKEGCLGIDTNPSGLALTLANKKGQPIKTIWIDTNALMFSNANKTNNLINEIAWQVINMATDLGVGIACESLKFNQKDISKKTNRTFHNFVHSRLLQQIKRKANQNRIEFKSVNPAFTTFIGKTKYSYVYNLGNHHSAALVIARRALGFKERIPQNWRDKVLKSRASRSKSGGKTEQRYSNWQLWGTLYGLSSNGGLPASPSKVRNLKELRNRRSSERKQGTRKRYKIQGKFLSPKEGIPGNLPSLPREGCVSPLLTL